MTTLLTIDKSIDKMATLCCYLQKWCKMLNLKAMWIWITFRGIGVCRNKRHKLIYWKQLYIPHDSIKTSAHHSWIFLWNEFSSWLIGCVGDIFGCGAWPQKPISKLGGQGICKNDPRAVEIDKIVCFDHRIKLKCMNSKSTQTH